MALNKETEERIRADAAKYTNRQDQSLRGRSTDYGRRISKLDGIEGGYIAGATAENKRAQILVDVLEDIVKGYEYTKPHYPWWVKDAKKAIEQWKGKEEVELSCVVCGMKFMGPEPQMCCSGRDCGCMGLPIEPIVCSKECYDKGIPPQKGDSGVPVTTD